MQTNKVIMYPLPGEIYEHYKGGTYEIISMSTHTETQEKMVVYKSIPFGSVYVRPFDLFFSTVEVTDEKDNCFIIPRFKIKK